jgi:hypothetical protein
MSMHFFATLGDSLMISDLVAIACLVVGILGAWWFHRTVFSRFGDRRLGRLTAYVGAGLLASVGLGLEEALRGNGWHYMKFTNLEVHTSLSEGLTMGLELGVATGLIGFVVGELQGERSFFEIFAPHDNWEEYTSRILRTEGSSSRGARRRAAKVIRSTAEYIGEQLSPELSAYVRRNTGDGEKMSM